MYDSAVQVDPSLAGYGRPGADVEVAPRSAPVIEEPEPPADPSPPPAPTKAKGKGKPMQRKLYKPKSSLAKKRGADEDDDEALKPPSSNKLGLIIFLALVACGLVVVGVIVLRGRGKTEATSLADTTRKAEPLLEPAPNPEPPALAPAEPAAPAEPEEPEEPAKPARPARAAVEKPAPAERAARAERPRPEPTPAADPKAGGRPSEEDVRRAREAYQRGNAKLMAGNATDAIAEFSQALRLNPKDPSSHRALGLAHEQAGNISEAVRQLRLYLKAAPKASDRAMVEKKLRQLRRK
jgi:tetratricopeptide (TPR) repeat protein